MPDIDGIKARARAQRKADRYESPLPRVQHPISRYLSSTPSPSTNQLWYPPLQVCSTTSARNTKTTRSPQLRSMVLRAKRASIYLQPPAQCYAYLSVTELSRYKIECIRNRSNHALLTHPIQFYLLFITRGCSALVVNSTGLFLASGAKNHSNPGLVRNSSCRSP